jgi:hypothetical protein
LAGERDVCDTILDPIQDTIGPIFRRPPPPPGGGWGGTHTTCPHQPTTSSTGIDGLKIECKQVEGGGWNCNLKMREGTELPVCRREVREEL